MKNYRTFLLSAALLPYLLTISACASSPGSESAPVAVMKTYNGEEIHLADYQDKIVVLEWFNAGCPFVAKHYKSGHMPAMQKEFIERGVVWFVINSTNPRHENYLTPDKAKQTEAEWGIAGSKMINDEEGTVGKLFGAKTTPHMFLIKGGTIAYQGAIDNNPSTDSDPAKAQNYVKQALNELLAGKPVAKASAKPYGCSVKY
ncbi:MAG TPA: redoxin domain-containing protein [Oligoflexia bacterium]|nr:redoxin domain-containing protein [Oligoflexia bacterium]